MNGDGLSEHHRAEAEKEIRVIEEKIKEVKADMQSIALIIAAMPSTESLHEMQGLRKESAGKMPALPDRQDACPTAIEIGGE